MNKAVLFSCFSPDIGGGGVNFRTQIHALRGWEVTWAYLGYQDCRYDGCKTIRIGTPFVGGPLIEDLVRSPFLWSGLRREPVQALARRLAELQPNVFWILAMNEGVLLVPELKRMTGLRVHVSVQDDQEKGMFGRMPRYFWMAGLAREPLRRALTLAESVDVTSRGMQEYYRREFGLEAVVTHMAINSCKVENVFSPSPDEWRIGHIGTLYDERPALRFAAALRDVGQQSGRKVRWQMIGLAPRFNRLRAAFPDVIEDVGNLPEKAAVELLAQCDAVYAMYPFTRRAAVFRQTSFPTKLSTYVQAGRPIFAHTPSDSTLAGFVTGHALGMVCDSTAPEIITSVLESCLSLTVSAESFRQAARDHFGPQNIATIQHCLDSLGEGFCRTIARPRGSMGASDNACNS